jgi:hypothetical protein
MMVGIDKAVLGKSRYREKRKWFSQRDSAALFNSVDFKKMR